MQSFNRRSTPKVKNGKVQRKNRSELTPNFFDTPQIVPAIDRQRPGPGYRHVLKKKDIERLIPLLPDWDELSKGLNLILLATGDDESDGWHQPGIVAVCAWDVNQAISADSPYFLDHRQIFERLGVPVRAAGDGRMICEFTDSTIRAYQLLHILLHELGHHHDRMTTRSQRRSARGESYAEQYAIKYADRILDRYLDEFGLP